MCIFSIQMKDEKQHNISHWEIFEKLSAWQKFAQGSAPAWGAKIRWRVLSVNYQTHVSISNRNVRERKHERTRFKRIKDSIISIPIKNEKTSTIFPAGKYSKLSAWQNFAQGSAPAWGAKLRWKGIGTHAKMGLAQPIKPKQNHWKTTRSRATSRKKVFRTCIEFYQHIHKEKYQQKALTIKEKFTMRNAFKSPLWPTVGKMLFFHEVNDT